ncbi:hypothetical protein D3C80_1854740 [compost metagenome]
MPIRAAQFIAFEISGLQEVAFPAQVQPLQQPPGRRIIRITMCSYTPDLQRGKAVFQQFTAGFRRITAALKFVIEHIAQLPGPEMMGHLLLKI